MSRKKTSSETGDIPDWKGRKKAVRDSVLSLKITRLQHETFTVVAAEKGLRKTDILCGLIIQYVINNDETRTFAKRVKNEVFYNEAFSDETFRMSLEKSVGGFEDGKEQWIRKPLVRDKVLSLKITSTLHKAFNVVAASSGRTKTDILTDLIVQYIQNNDVSRVLSTRVEDELFAKKVVV